MDLKYSCLVALALAGCRGAQVEAERRPETPPGTGPASQTAEETSRSLAGPTVRLLAAGAEPRRELRYKFNVGRSQTMVMEITTSISTELELLRPPRVDMPLLRMTIGIEPTGITGDGNLRYETRVENAEVVQTSGADPLQVAVMESLLEKAVGHPGWTIMDRRGFIRGGDFNIPPGLDSEGKQIMESMHQSMRQLLAHLPVEAVGAGARWEVTVPMEMQGMRLTQVTTYTLTELGNGERVKFDVALRQMAPPQRIHPPGESSSPILLESLEGTGQGSMSFDLGSLVPNYKIESSQTTRLNLGSRDNSPKIRMRVQQVIWIYEKEAST